jgi:hypothetical protein
MQLGHHERGQKYDVPDWLATLPQKAKGNEIWKMILPFST